jgi:hypothetical protein
LRKYLHIPFVIGPEGFILPQITTKHHNQKRQICLGATEFALRVLIYNFLLYIALYIYKDFSDKGKFEWLFLLLREI